MLGKFLDDLGLAPRRKLQVFQPLSDFVFPVWHVRLLSSFAFPAAAPPDLRKRLCPSKSFRIFIWAAPRRFGATDTSKSSHSAFSPDPKTQGHSPTTKAHFFGRAQPLPQIRRRSRE